MHIPQIPADLNARFALPSLRFTRGPGELAFAEIDNALGTAGLCLQGAHITTFHPRGQAEPVVWLSEEARFAPGKSIRGGVPVCWPWFGPHATQADFPAHGFARTMPWQVTGSAQLATGETEILLQWLDTRQSQTQWPHPCRLELKAVVGENLRIELTTSNMGSADILIGEALHTYFHIGDIGRIVIRGLEGCEYVDKVDGGARKTQTGALTCGGEVDRVYVDTAATCTIEDPELRRRIVVEKSGSRSTVVWTPWADKAAAMGDLGPVIDGRGGWRGMVCVESGNALDNVVTVPAGQSHTLGVTYSVLPL
ncbi:MAG TPA: D-hexose-6-phosphate mutarotase [Thiobacillaceae bacterium]|nr:D-hexose-6-phosphate mutarotase [Thiobacillaceae bacterium]HNU65023.1 D-hexose-6-phosphate mutarotase [Thiobacillaceae bacterium]